MVKVASRLPLPILLALSVATRTAFAGILTVNPPSKSARGWMRTSHWSPSRHRLFAAPLVTSTSSRENVSTSRENPTVTRNEPLTGPSASLAMVTSSGTASTAMLHSPARLP